MLVTEVEANKLEQYTIPTWMKIGACVVVAESGVLPKSASYAERKLGAKRSAFYNTKEMFDYVGRPLSEFDIKQHPES